MYIDGNMDATLCRQCEDDDPVLGDIKLAIGRLREAGEILLAYPASQRRWLFVDTPAGKLRAHDVERLRSDGWRLGAR